MLRIRAFRLFELLVAATVLLGIGVEPAAAIGYYNLPGSFCQCFGYGNGAGYHSCLVLGPSSWEGGCSKHEVRLHCPPQPPYAWYRNCNCSPAYCEPQLVEPTLLPAPGPEYAPGPAAMRPQILR